MCICDPQHIADDKTVTRFINTSEDHTIPVVPNQITGSPPKQYHHGPRCCAHETLGPCAFSPPAETRKAAPVPRLADIIPPGCLREWHKPND